MIDHADYLEHLDKAKQKLEGESKKPDKKIELFVNKMLFIRFKKAKRYNFFILLQVFKFRLPIQNVKIKMAILKHFREIQ